MKRSDPVETRLASKERAAETLPTQPRSHAISKDLPEWRQGEVLLDLYEVRGILGEGGMGKVYEVYHKGWGISLAVKIPKPEPNVFYETFF